MIGINHVILLGNLGKDPEIRHLEGGKIKASFPLATNEMYKNKEGKKVTRAEWHNVVVWSRLAEIAEKYLKKGKQIYVEGRLYTRSYEEKNGQSKYVTEILGHNIILLGGIRDHSSESEINTNVNEETACLSEAILDDLPS